MHSPRGQRAHLLDVLAVVTEGRLRVTFSYSRNRHRHESMERLASRYQSALEALIEHCLSPDAGGYLPCDFPLAAITRAELRALAPAPVRVEDLLRLSPMQMGILYHTVGDGDAQTYFSQITLRGTGPWIAIS